MPEINVLSDPTFPRLSIAGHLSQSIAGILLHTRGPATVKVPQDAQKRVVLPSPFPAGLRTLWSRTAAGLLLY